MVIQWDKRRSCRLDLERLRVTWVKKRPPGSGATASGFVQTNRRDQRCDRGLLSFCVVAAAISCAACADASRADDHFDWQKRLDVDQVGVALGAKL